MEKACTLNDFEPKLNDVRKRKKEQTPFLLLHLRGYYKDLQVRPSERAQYYL